MPSITEKRCSSCNGLKSKNEFSKRSQSNDGLQTVCKSCHSIYRTNNSDHRKTYNDEYRKRRPEVGRISQKKYRTLNIEKIRKTNREYARRIRKEQPEKHHQQDRIKALIRNYGITVDTYNTMFEKQGGVCATCRKPEISKYGYLCVDHDHATGKVRGLLCRRCNATLGLVDDNQEILHSLIQYLDAAMAYNEKALEYFGEFAKTNVIPNIE